MVRCSCPPTDPGAASSSAKDRSFLFLRPEDEAGSGVAVSNTRLRLPTDLTIVRPENTIKDRAFLHLQFGDEISMDRTQDLKYTLLTEDLSQSPPLRLIYYLPQWSPHVFLF